MRWRLRMVTLISLWTDNRMHLLENWVNSIGSKANDRISVCTNCLATGCIVKAKTVCDRLFRSTYIFCENRFRYRFCSVSHAENKCIHCLDRRREREWVRETQSLCCSALFMLTRVERERANMSKLMHVQFLQQPNQNHTMCIAFLRTGSQ